jgi:hypothetical protein
MFHFCLPHSHGATRCICVAKKSLLLPTPSPAAADAKQSGGEALRAYDYFVERSGHLYMEGPSVERAARAAHSQLSAAGGSNSWLDKRVERDGPYHHITVLHTAAVDEVKLKHADYKGGGVDVCVSLGWWVGGL